MDKNDTASDMASTRSLGDGGDSILTRQRVLAVSVGLMFNETGEAAIGPSISRMRRVWRSCKRVERDPSLCRAEKICGIEYGGGLDGLAGDPTCSDRGTARH